ncbi:MAG TPA: ABC transporter substrate-binding protein [Acetobacteraceae bacterium]|nr:ABC transporter substrate-binding protein [Acetobacteraceae bacterium]
MLAAGALAFGAAAAPRAQAAAAHTGGTLKLVSVASEGTIDPQINYTSMYWQVFFVTYDGLVGFEKTSGPDSNTIVADLATEIPKPQDAGKTYVFTLRRGIKFSNGKTVTPDDVVASFRRLFKVSNPNAGTWYNVIVGADACLKTPATCTLSGGVVADDKANTVTFHLTAPDAEFMDKLAVPFGTILPADTAAKDLGTTPAPTTGPYMISQYDPNRIMKLVRNPYFKQWSAQAQPAGYVDEIDFNYGLSDEAAVTAVENGQADWMFNQPPTDRLGELGTKYAKQIYIRPLFAFYYAAMNANLAPFNNLKVRQAVNFATDRRATVNLYGGPRLAQPTCQILPPGFPGYEPYCPWTKNPGKTWTAPDLAKAKALMQQSGVAPGTKVTLIVIDRAADRAIGGYLQSMLNSLGFAASLKAISPNIQFTYIQNTKNQVQISLTDWYQDYPAPSDFLNVLFSCANFHPGSDSSINISGFCDKGIDAHMQKALSTAVADPEAALGMWAKIDQQVTDQAPVAPLFAPKHLDFVSTRLGNYTWSDQFHMIFSKVWVQ